MDHERLNIGYEVLESRHDGFWFVGRLPLYMQYDEAAKK